MTRFGLGISSLSILAIAGLAAPLGSVAGAATPTGRVEIVGNTMRVQAAIDRPAKFELASEGAEFPDGHVEHYVSLETGRKDDAYTIVAPCTKANHDGPVEILCPAELVQHVDVRMTDKSDKLTMEYLLFADLTVDGGLGNDRLDALGAQTCTISGGDGNDSLGGCQRNTTLNGDAGNDKLTMPWTAGRGYPRQLNGGSGKDRITGNVDIDTVDCGPDADRATVDARDTTVNCELVKIR
jgi:Ca2+-binding RTX toxin-like protein